MAGGLCIALVAAVCGASLADDELTSAPPSKKVSDSNTGKNGSKLKWLPQRPEPTEQRVDRAVIQAECDVPADAPSGQMRGSNRGAPQSAAPMTTQSVETTTKALRNPFGDKSATAQPAPAETIVGEMQPSLGEPSLGQIAPAEPMMRKPILRGRKLARQAPAEAKDDGYLPSMTPGAPDLMPGLPPPTNGAEKLANPPTARSKKTEARQPELLEQETVRKEHELKETCPSPKDLKKIRDIGTNIKPEAGDLPQDCPLGNEAFQARCWSRTTFAWTASGLCHKPLYFDDTSLEVYGHMWGPWVQPFLSGARFFGTFFILPYEMGLEPPNECIYALGDYRPGDCAPYLLDPLPLSVRAALFEAGAWTGGVFLFH